MERGLGTTIKFTCTFLSGYNEIRTLSTYELPLYTPTLVQGFLPRISPLFFCEEHLHLNYSMKGVYTVWFSIQGPTNGPTSTVVE